MPLDYEFHVKKFFEENRLDVVRAMKSGEIDKKIDNFCELHGFEREKVMKEIENNEIVAALFCKDPRRQGVHEKIAAEYIKKIKGVSNFKNLPSSKYDVVKGRVILRKELKKKGGYSRAKSIDFHWEYRGAEFWAAHKYTKEEGGAQGNQYKDLQEFIIQSRGGRSPNVFFLAIADGEFYQMQNGQAGMRRIDYLKKLAADPHIDACAIDELEALMRQLIKKRKRA